MVNDLLLLKVVTINFRESTVRMSKSIDVIIFGASGYSGKHVVQKFYEISKKGSRSVTWGVAGRSRLKLKEVLNSLGDKPGSKFDNIPIIEADTKNESSLIHMAAQARLIINCTGPYKFHGEQVIRACIQEKCHYVDLAAEPQFMERMQLFYNEEAAKNGVYIVTACAIDSVPSDIGLDFLQKKFNGTLNSVECYQELKTDGNFGKGAAINFGTLESFLHVMFDYAELKEIRRKLFRVAIPHLEPELRIRRYLHQIPLSKSYAGPYPGGEATVMRRSERYFYENNQKRPIQIHTYVGSTKCWHYLVVFMAFMCLLLLLKFRFAMNLILKYPKLFTFGFFGKEPNEVDTSKVQIVTTLYGRGWGQKNVDSNFKEVENSWIIGKVSGRDGYKITGICATASALVLLNDTQNLPKNGGVFTTASCFTNTNLVELLQRNGLKFEIAAQGCM